MVKLRIPLFGLVALAFTVGACAQQREPNKSAAPPAQPTPSPPPPPPPGYPHHYSQPMPGAIPAPGSTPKPKAIERPLARTPEEAEEEIAQLTQELDTIFGGTKVEAMGDTRCLRSCKALASMRRAVDRLCELTDGDERCTRARERLERSERKVTDAGCSCG